MFPFRQQSSKKEDPCANKPLWYLKYQARLGKLSPFYDCLSVHRIEIKKFLAKNLKDHQKLKRTIDIYFSFFLFFFKQIFYGKKRRRKTTPLRTYLFLK